MGRAATPPRESLPHTLPRWPASPDPGPVVHAALIPSLAYSGLNKEKGMGEEWGRGKGVSGRQEGRGAQPCRR
eukprot:scaffold10820_cov132-Isochrysis_galbana.AAC.1